MKNKFTKGAEIALKSAREAAEALGHTHIGSEHLLLGISATPSSVGARILETANIDKEILYVKTKELLGSGTVTSLAPNDLTTRAKRILSEASKKAESLGFVGIGTEHLLYCILTDDDSTACSVLKHCKIQPKALITELQCFFGSITDLSEPRKEDKKKAVTKKGSVLLEYGKDLTAEAERENIGRIIGREKEIMRVIKTLCRRTKNNPILIGEPGVGKTAIAEGLALAICEKRVPDQLKGKQVISLDLSSMIAGAKYRGEFEDRLKNVISAAKDNKDVIIFIDEIHTIIGAGSAEGALDAANILKPSLARGEIKVIGATTIDEYIKHIERDAALERRFQPIKVNEPTQTECLEMLFGIKEGLENHHGITISDGAINAAVRLSVQYIPEKYLPDKAIDIIDEAASGLKLSACTVPDSLSSAEQTLKTIRKNKSKALLSGDTETAEKLRAEETEASKTLLEERIRFEKHKKEYKPILTEHDVLLSLSEQTGIELCESSSIEKDTLASLPSILKNEILGQEEAIDLVCSTVLKSKIGIRDPKKPIGSFIFCGPSGVGKTALAKALADQPMFRGGIIRLDMSEYTEHNSISKLIGSPPGYVGYDECGKLTDKVRSAPNSVILFDKIEKADKEIFNLLLQILDDGVLTDNRSKTAYFSNCVIILSTSSSSAVRSIGFGKTDLYESKSCLSDVFPQDILERIDEIVEFKPLSEEAKKEIIRRAIEKIKEKLCEIGYFVDINEKVSAEIIKESKDSVRSIYRSIKRLIEEPISVGIIKCDITRNEIYTLTVSDGKSEIKQTALCI